MDIDYDPFADTAVGDVRDPYPDYAVARRTAPVAEEEQYGTAWVQVYRYSDVGAVLADPETFSSSLYKETLGQVMGPTILQMGGHEHHVNRGLVASAFRRKALESWERSLIEPAVHSLIDRFCKDGEADLVRQLTFLFPIRVISGILGIPPGDEQRFARWSLELISWAVDFERGKAAARSIRTYVGEILEERRVRPADDLISSLAHAEIDGKRLSDDAIFGFINLLMPAGAETTYRLLGSLLFALLSDPSLGERVRHDRSLIGPAIEETLRWEAPVQFVARSPARDVTIGGVPIRAGTALTCVLGSANRDETVYQDPDRFDIERFAAGHAAPAHLAFADGPHRCLGEHLARMETTVAVNALLDRLPSLRLNPDDADPHIHGLAFRSPTSLPVRFDS